MPLNAIWPGTEGTSLQNCSYTCSHGITPGIALLTIAPAPGMTADNIALAGDLVLTDGLQSVIIPRCKVRQIHADGPSPGFTWTLEILDRRWMWQEPGGGVLHGMYNVRDTSGWMNRPPPDSGPILQSPTRFIPWTVRTPTQLAGYCLDAMGETGYSILLPDVTAESLPACNFDYTNPAVALQQLCESLGCRIILRLDTNTVLIAPVGVGGPLPTGGSIARASPSVAIPPRPDRIIFTGGPALFQDFWLLEAVGKEFDGQAIPINDLSYAPVAIGLSKVMTVTPTSPEVGDVFTIIINGISVSYTAISTSVANVCNALNTAINANPQLGIFGNITATTDGSTITINGNPNGDDFSLECEVVNTSGSTSTMTWSEVRPGVKPDNPWQFSPPPSYAGVTATDRLTRLQAEKLAQESVFRWYRIVNVDPATGKKPHVVPEFGAILRIQQVLLEDQQLYPNYPVSPDWNTKFINGGGDPIIKDYYDGYSRERSARVYGSYQEEQSGITSIKPADQVNTPPEKQVFVPFRVDAERQMIIFERPVFFQLGEGTTAGAKAPTLYLETSFQLRSPDTNQIVRTLAYYDFPPPLFGAPPAVIRHEDVQFMAAAVRDLKTKKLQGVDTNRLEMQLRANYYLQAEALKYQISGGQTLRWNGILQIWNDGAIQQVTWEVSDRGAFTTASLNTEHNVFVPSYPERLRLAYLRSPEKWLLPPIVQNPGKPGGP